MVHLQECHQLSQSIGPYFYNVVAPGATINLLQLWTNYQVATGEITNHDSNALIQKIAHPQQPNQRYIPVLL